MVNFINSTLRRSLPMRKYGKCAKIRNLRVAYYAGDILEISKADRICVTMNIRHGKKFFVCDFFGTYIEGTSLERLQPHPS